MRAEVVWLVVLSTAGFAGSWMGVLLAMGSAARRARPWVEGLEAADALSEEVSIGLARRARPVGLFFLLPPAMLGLILAVNLGSGLALSVVMVPVGALSGIAAASLVVALVLLGVLPQRAGVVLADRVRLSVPGVLGAGERVYPWAATGLASLNVVDDLSVAVARVDGRSTCLLVDGASLEAMRGFWAAAVRGPARG